MKLVPTDRLINSIINVRLGSRCKFSEFFYSNAPACKYSYYASNRTQNIMPLIKDFDASKAKTTDDANLTKRLTRVKQSLSEKYNVTFERSPIKSPNDTKEYLVMKLTNGLTALLVSDAKNLIGATNFKSDETTAKEILEYGESRGSLKADTKPTEKLAACSLTVGAGSFNDPEEIPGLAHLLEHMLFMGSEKFQDENEFNSFLTPRGGSNNAVTDCEFTTYFFDCPEVYLEETMNRFANFFIAPLMKRDSMIRERQAIESEFQMHSKNDALRALQIIATAAPKENPAHKFMWGNLKTLRDDVEEDRLYKTLREFWQTNYSPHRMTVAVQARLPLSTLGRWVVDHFGKIRAPADPKASFILPGLPFKTDSFNKVYTVMPVSDTNLLRLTWALPPVQHLYRSKPTLYPSFVVGHEGKGSLISYLKKNLWALSLVAGSGNDGTESNKIFSLFTIGILLTEKGLRNVDRVLAAVFSYIRMVQVEKPSEMIYKEIQFMSETNFRFSPETMSSEYVQYLSQCMQAYPPEHYLIGSRLLFDFKPEEISEFLCELTPERVNVMLISKAAAGNVTLDLTEKWFATKYNAADIPERWMHQWKTCKPDSSFYTPSINPFIPSDFRILPAEGVKPVLYPEKLIADDRLELWYKQDRKFLLPFGYINIYMISPLATALPQTFVMCDLFVLLFSAVYDEELYPSTVAGIGHSLWASDYGLLLSVTGYNEKLVLFLETIFNLMATLHKDTEIGIFEAVKDEQRKTYYNELLNPTVLAKDLRLSVLCEPFCTSITKLEAISSIDLKKFQDFCTSLFENVYVKCLVQGNLSKSQALDISERIKGTFKYEPLICSRPDVRVRRLPKGERVIRAKALNAEDNNCHVTNYYQCGLSDDVKESCLIELLMLNMMEPLFDTLRTKEQLGYFVNNDMRYTYGVLGFSLIVKFQSDKFTVGHVESRMSEFLKKMKTDLKNLKTDHFNRLKESMKTLKLHEDTQLADEVDRNWSEIESNEYVFDRIKRSVDYLDTLEKKDIYKYFVDVLETEGKSSLFGDRRLRKISIQVVANEHNSKSDSLEKKIVDRPPADLKHVLELITPEENGAKSKFIEDINAFQKSLYVYPVLKLKLQ